MNFEYKEQWNEIFDNHINLKKEIKYNLWLDNYYDNIIKDSLNILDLGCGYGNNIKYLLEKGKTAAACDYSDSAIKIINDNFPNIETKTFDMSEGLKYEDNTFDLIISELSLHYFSEEVTLKVIKELKRILNKNGKLILKVNSVKEFENGHNKGKEIEENFYELNNMKKRFFNEEEIKKFFKEWNVVNMLETEMIKYYKPKVALECLIEVIK